MGWYSVSLSMNHSRTFEIFAHEICSPLYISVICLSDHLFMSVWTHRFLIYTLDYNPVLLYFVAQIVPALTIENSKLDSFIPWTHPIIVCFTNTGCSILFLQEDTWENLSKTRIKVQVYLVQKNSKIHAF